MNDSRRRTKRHRVRECQLTFRQSGVIPALSFKSGSVSFPVSDLSQTGLSFVADESFDVATKLKLFLDVPAFVKSLKIEAEVVWSQKMEGYDNYFRTGVRFLKMDKEVRSHLNRLDHDTMLHNVRREIPKNDEN